MVYKNYLMGEKSNCLMKEGEILIEQVLIVPETETTEEAKFDTCATLYCLLVIAASHPKYPNLLKDRSWEM